MLFKTFTVFAASKKKEVLEEIMAQVTKPYGFLNLL